MHVIDVARKLWLSFEEAAEYSGLEVAYIERLARKRMVVCCPGGPGGALVIHRDSLERFQTEVSQL